MIRNHQHLAVNAPEFGKNLSKSDRDRIAKMHKEMRKAIETSMLAAVKKQQMEEAA